MNEQASNIEWAPVVRPELDQKTLDGLEKLRGFFPDPIDAYRLQEACVQGNLKLTKIGVENQKIWYLVGYETLESGPYRKLTLLLSGEKQGSPIEIISFNSEPLRKSRSESFEEASVSVVRDKETREIVRGSLTVTNYFTPSTLVRGPQDGNTIFRFEV